MLRSKKKEMETLKERLTLDCVDHILCGVGDISIRDLLRFRLVNRQFRHLVDTCSFWPTTCKKWNIGPPNVKARKYRTNMGVVQRSYGKHCENCGKKFQRGAMNKRRYLPNKRVCIDCSFATNFKLMHSLAETPGLDLPDVLTLKQITALYKLPVYAVKRCFPHVDPTSRLTIKETRVIAHAWTNNVYAIENKLLAQQISTRRKNTLIEIVGKKMVTSDMQTYPKYFPEANRSLIFAYLDGTVELSHVVPALFEKNDRRQQLLTLFNRAGIEAFSYTPECHQYISGTSELSINDVFEHTFKIAWLYRETTFASDRYGAAGFTQWIDDELGRWRAISKWIRTWAFSTERRSYTQTGQLKIPIAFHSLVNELLHCHVVEHVYRHINPNSDIKTRFPFRLYALRDCNLFHNYALHGANLAIEIIYRDVYSLSKTLEPHERLIVLPERKNGKIDFLAVQ